MLLIGIKQYLEFVHTVQQDCTGLIFQVIYFESPCNSMHCLGNADDKGKYLVSI